MIDEAADGVRPVTAIGKHAMLALVRPPICEACAHTPAEDLVRFADYAPLPDGMVGHPAGLGWFCASHLARARALSYLSMVEALAVMGHVRTAWWRRLFVGEPR